MKTTNQPTTAWACMREWNPHFRSGDLPVWLRKHIRATIIATDGLDRWRRQPWPDSYLPLDVFDHWGSIPSPAGDSRRWVYAMPYARPDRIAREFAERFGLQLVIAHPGAWHPKTTLYLYSPPP